MGNANRGLVRGLQDFERQESRMSLIALLLITRVGARRLKALKAFSSAARRG